MNVAVINAKDILRYFIKLLSAMFILFIVTKLILNSNTNIKQVIVSKANNDFLILCLELSIPNFKTAEDIKTEEIKITNLMKTEIAMFNIKTIETEIDNSNIEVIEQEDVTEQTTASPQIEIPKTADTEEVTDRNTSSTVTNYYGTIKIDNQSDYTITEEMLVPDVELTNKEDIIIFHTHTCESYTPCDIYDYTMTGNYRTTDSNYNIVRVGAELTTYLTDKGFNVIHDETYHDYPSYSGSYSRSLETVEKLLEGTSAELVLDLHRDAVGDGDTYGPTVMINGQRVAQLMFVIGTDGGGLEHTNWIQNLKVAIKIQEKANEMYPGLFRSIIIRNSRYNQHISIGASIIEVGATANTLGECLLSMQCLANVMEEVCK